MLTALLLALAGDPITATVVDPNGKPIEGAALVVTLAGTDVDTVHSDVNGFLSLPMPDERASLRIEAEGMRPVPFHAVAIRSQTDLGEITLHPPGVLTGRIVDQNGDRVPGQWVVSAVVAETAPVRRHYAITARLDADTGEFRFDDLPGGVLGLQAQSHRLGLGISKLEVEITPGHESFAELTYEGPDLRQVLRLEAKVPALPDAAPPVRGKLVSADGKRTNVLLLARRGNARKLFTDLGEAPYTFELNDSRYRKETFGPFEAGTIPFVEPIGLGTVDLELVDAATGLPMKEAEVVWRYRGKWLRLKKGRVGRVERLEGLLAAEGTSLEIKSGGQTLCTHELPLLTEQPLAVRIEVPRPANLTAIVTKDGQPVPGVEASLFMRSDSRQQVTGQTGRTIFTGLPSGQHNLVLDLGPFHRIEREVTVEGPKEVVIEVPPTGEVTFQPKPPEGLRLDELPGELRLRVAEEKRSGVHFALPHPVTLLIDLEKPMTLPTGTVPLELVVTHRQRRSWTTLPIPLPPVRVDAGNTTVHEIDLDGIAPAALDVVVLRKGAPVRDAELVRVKSPANSWAMFDRLPSRCLISPGTYKLRVKYEDWSETFEVTLGSGEYYERTFHVED